MTHQRLILSGLLAACMGLCGCSTLGTAKVPPRVKLITPQRVYHQLTWNPEELTKDVAVRSHRVTRSASYHTVRVRTAEKPHVHDKHDMVVTVLSGIARIHLGLKSFDLKPGDVVEIPRGTIHWVENLSAKQAYEAFVVFTPPYHGRDKRVIDLPR